MAAQADDKLAQAPPNGLEQADGGGRADIERLDGAGHRNFDFEFGLGDQFAPHALPFSAEDPGERALPARFIERGGAIEAGNGCSASVVGHEGCQVGIFVDDEGEMGALPGAQHFGRPGGGATGGKQDLSDAGGSSGA